MRNMHLCEFTQVDFEHKGFFNVDYFLSGSGTT